MSLSTQIRPLGGSVSLDQTSVGKLLLNAWSAEFALRIKLGSSDRDFLNHALSWAFPQAYLALLFSARAVLAIDGIRIANPATIEKLLSQWAHGGIYGSGFTREKNPFGDLMQQCMSGQPPTQRLSGPEAAALHVKLTEKIHAISLIHEMYIINRMGAEAYGQLIDGVPAYLKDGFVGARATFLLTDD